MAYERMKTEMHGDTSRWGYRADVKHMADRLRRSADKHACAEDMDEPTASPPTSASDDPKP